ncbi:hypothetical protein N1851_019573 [Merluccius polli]|uniref:Uncharacterized protein n=1 Tax=Merluccius polli TaxID=89951 RepID=A0AA47NXJ3_MERPO|nr:hypothetical protein N1851_019573 [Merluccius polli]
MVAVVEEVEAVVSRSDPPILSPSGFIKGTKVASFVAKSNRSSGFENELCEFFKQHSVFGQKWDVGIGPSVYGGFGLDESALLEKVQEH